MFSNFCRLKKELLFSAIARRTKLDFRTKNIGNNFVNSIKTKSGNTQKSERQCINFFRNILDDLSLEYQTAGSQQSKDFRNIGGFDLDIEIKKTDNFNVFFNDTLPNENIYYIIFFTGRTYKDISKNIDPAILFLNGFDLVKRSPWVNEYHQDINYVKNKWCSGENKKNLPGPMEVYVRPGYKANIREFIDINMDGY